jgi:hypothetical protein
MIKCNNLFNNLKCKSNYEHNDFKSEKVRCNDNRANREK